MNRFLPILLFIFTTACYAQTRTLNGVYAGVEVSLPTVMGQGMDRTDRVILFRPDGTFNVNLRAADWKTAVTGRYTIAGDKVTLQYAKGAKEFMTLEKDGDLQATGDMGSYGMLRMATFNSVPPGLYKFSNVSGTGGGASGQIFTGTSSNVGLYFDGKGNFSRNSSGGTMVAGDNVGGGTSHKDNSGGTYTIKDGVLNLRFADGKTETHSFFCRPGEKPLMAAINGRIYFMEDAATTRNPVAATKPASENKPTETKTADARETLYKANKVQGGTSLDQLQRLQVSGTASGVTVLTKVDLVNEKIRIEMSKGSQLAGIEQLRGNQGWQWQNGKKTPLTPARIREIKSGFYSGILGLRKQVIDQMQDLKLQQSPANTISISCTIDGEKHVYMLNDKGQLLGDASGANASMYSDLKMVDGILWPFSEKLRVNGQVVQIQYTRYVMNPAFTAADWEEK